MEHMKPDTSRELAKMLHYGQEQLLKGMCSANQYRRFRKRCQEVIIEMEELTGEERTLFTPPKGWRT